MKMAVLLKENALRVNFFSIYIKKHAEIEFYLHKDFCAAGIEFYLHKDFRAAEIEFYLHKEFLRKINEYI